MPTFTSTVGPETIPVPTGGTNSALQDPTLVGLLDFVGFFIKDALDAKLAEMGGPVTSAAISDACPATNRFPWDHAGTFMRPHPATGSTEAPLPGLWAWEMSSEPTAEYSTLLHRTAFVRTVKTHYVFPLVQIPDGFSARSGLLSTVGRALQRASEFGRHPSYAYGGDALGTPIWKSLNWISFTLTRGEPGRLAITPPTSTQNNGGRPGGEGHVQRFFPAYSATWQIVERVEGPQPSYPADVNTDATMTIATGDNVGDTVDVLERVLIGPGDTDHS